MIQESRISKNRRGRRRKGGSGSRASPIASQASSPPGTRENELKSLFIAALWPRRWGSNEGTHSTEHSIPLCSLPPPQALKPFFSWTPLSDSCGLLVKLGAL